MAAVRATISGAVREEIARAAEPRAAIERTAHHVGESITFSAGTVIVALLCMLIASFGLYSGLGPALAVGVALMLLAARHHPDEGTGHRDRARRAAGQFPAPGTPPKIDMPVLLIRGHERSLGVPFASPPPRRRGQDVAERSRTVTGVVNLGLRRPFRHSL